MNTYCDQFCKNTYYFGTDWDIRCRKTELIKNEEFQNPSHGKIDNRTCFTYNYQEDCLQYQFAKEQAIQIKRYLNADPKFKRFYDKMNNKPKRTIGTREHPITDFLKIFKLI